MAQKTHRFPRADSDVKDGSYLGLARRRKMGPGLRPDLAIIPDLLLEFISASNVINQVFYVDHCTLDVHDAESKIGNKLVVAFY